MSWATLFLFGCTCWIIGEQKCLYRTKKTAIFRVVFQKIFLFFVMDII